MSDPLDMSHDIPHTGQRLVWVFSFDGAVEELEAMTPEALAEALGLWMPPAAEAVEWFDLAAMTEYGFARYLTEASGFDIGADAERLDGLSGVVVLLFADGLNEKDNRFAPEPPFDLIGRYGMPVELPPITGIESESAAGLLAQGKPPKSEARMSGMVATFVLLFLAVFVAVFVWIGG